MVRKYGSIILYTVAATCAAVAAGFTVYNMTIFLTTSRDVQDFLPADFLRDQLFLNMLVSMHLGIFGYAILKIRRRRFDEQKAALNDKMVREINFRDTAINAHTIVSVTDIDGNVLEVNQNFTDTFGYAEDEIVGQNTAMLYDERAKDQSYLDVRKATLTRRVWTGEQRLVTKSGDAIYVNTTVVPQYDDAGNHLRNVTMRTDVTAARFAEADRFLKLMLEELQDEVYVYSVDTLQISYVNRAARERCEWSTAEISTKRICDTAPLFDETAFRHHVAPVIHGDKPVVTIEVMHPKGPVEVSTRLMEGIDGRKMFVSVLRDISWRKELELAKIQSVSMVSHELRTPLTSIKGGIRLLQSGVLGEFDDSAVSVLDIASRNTDRLLTVVNDILDLEKIHSNKMDFTMTDVDLIALANEATEINRGYAEEHGVRFETRFDLDRAVVKGNADRLMQVLTNLMSNAVKFSPVDGVVTLMIEQRHADLRITVKDAGPGISPEEQSKLFKTFSQAVPADGRKREGTGLGLAIVKSILKHHRFRVGIASTVGVGTKFFFDIPAEKQVAVEKTTLIAEAG